MTGDASDIAVAMCGAQDNEMNHCRVAGWQKQFHG